MTTEERSRVLEMVGYSREFVMKLCSVIDLLDEPAALAMRILRELHDIEGIVERCETTADEKGVPS